MQSTENIQRSQIQTASLEMIRAKPGTSFVELLEISGFSGDMNMLWDAPEGSNIILWSGVSQEAAAALRALFADGTTVARPTPVLTYLIDGRSFTLPLAKSIRHYTRLRWLPVAFYMRNPDRKQGGEAQRVILKRSMLPVQGKRGRSDGF